MVFRLYKKTAFVLATLFFLTVHSVRADIVALSTAAVGTQSLSSSVITNNGSFLRISFTTNSNQTQKFTGIKFNNLGTGSFNFKATLNWGNSTTNPVSGGSDTLTYSSANTLINFTNIANTTLNSSTQYTINFTLNQGTDVTFTNFSIANSTDLTNNTTWIGTSSQSSGPTTGAGSGPAFSLYATVPEPGTMILTGSALIAGAVGAHFKRRRKKRLEVVAAD